jgi:hypothetical protein
MIELKQLFFKSRITNHQRESCVRDTDAGHGHVLGEGDEGSYSGWGKRDEARSLYHCFS